MKHHENSMKVVERLLEKRLHRIVSVNEMQFVFIAVHTHTH